MAASPGRSRSVGSVTNHRFRPAEDAPLLSVSICSPLGVIYQAQAQAVEVHARSSVWQVAPNANLFLTISDLSRVVIQCPDRETTFTLSGIMKICGNEITLLSEAPLAQ